MNKSTPPKGYRVEKVASMPGASVYGAYLEQRPAHPGQPGLLQTIDVTETRAAAVVACWEHRAKNLKK
jgi:hypothetical protein